jgi:hypothetical protein
MMAAVLSAGAARKLARRRPLTIDARAHASVAIKRNVHEVELAAGADLFARTFAEVMRAERPFGLIQIKRPWARAGCPFEVGDRFLGSISLERVLAARGLALPWPGLLRRVATWIEENATSDYAEVTALSPLEARYRYLEGTPMAGESCFSITPLGPRRCRFTSIFEYQELGGLAITILHRFGLKLHDAVVAAQVAESARRIGAQILSSSFAS